MINYKNQYRCYRLDAHYMKLSKCKVFLQDGKSDLYCETRNYKIILLYFLPFILLPFVLSINRTRTVNFR